MKELSYSCSIIIVSTALCYYLVLGLRLYNIVDSISSVLLFLILLSESLLVIAYLVKKRDKRWKLAPVISPILVMCILIIEIMGGLWGDYSNDTMRIFIFYMMVHAFLILPVCIYSGYKTFIQPYYK
ncbi:MAG: hypothetical protein WKF97_00670 [Chitinophagaceae bacterium]